MSSDVVTSLRARGESVLDTLVRSDRLPVALSIVVVVVAWHLLASTVPAYTFPTPPELVAALGTVFSGAGEYSPVTNYGYTLLRMAVASVACLVVGVGLGILMGLHTTAKEYTYVYLLVTFALPSVIWAFLGVLWFGLTALLVPVFAVSMIVTPSVAIIVEEGMGDLDRDLVEMGGLRGRPPPSLVAGLPPTPTLLRVLGGQDGLRDDLESGRHRRGLRYRPRGRCPDPILVHAR